MKLVAYLWASAAQLCIILACAMTAQDHQGDYLLGNSDAEHERLIRQASSLRIH
jgi:hypothetical protein